MTARAIREGRQLQGVDEKIVYSITTTPWGSSPTSVTVVAKDMSASAQDVSATVLSGSPAVIGDVITLPKVQSLTAEHLYRIEIKFICGNNTFECYFEIQAEL